MSRVWWGLGQGCLVMARRCELRAQVACDRVYLGRAIWWKKKAEEFFQRIEGQ